MKRSYRILICSIGIILGLGIIGTAIYVAKNNLIDTKSVANNSQPPSMPGGQNSNGSNQPPSMPGGDQNSSGSNQPPSMPGGDQNSSGSNQPPSMPSNDQNSSSSHQPPSMPNSSQSSNDNFSFPFVDASTVPKLTVWYIVAIVCGALILGVSLSYLFLSFFGKNNVFISKEKNITYIITSIIICALVSFGVIYYTNNNILLKSTYSPTMKGFEKQDSSNVQSNGKTTVTGTEELTDSYSSEDSDENAILVNSSGVATIDGATVEKTGDSSNTETGDFYGTNAAILVKANASATISNTTITTNGKGANAVFSTGENSKIYISDSTIKTTGSSSSRGLDATYGGYIEGKNLKITTQGGSCATLATDRGEGTVKVSDSTLETNGAGSPIIYSTGNISIDNTKGTANGSQLVVVEGKNSATVTNSNLTASGKGNRSGDVDQAGVMIYQSMSGDAGQGTGTFTATDSTLSISKSSSNYKTAPMFFVTNTDAKIILKNTKLNFGSNILLSAKATSEWGNSGSNGGTVTFEAYNQKLSGNIEIDNISTLILTLKDDSTYEGTINNENTAKSIVVNISSDSKWTLTGDTYISELNDDDSSYSNIDFNGYKLYVNNQLVTK